MGRLDQRKLATCCYCGSRAVLDLTARGGHELACGSCGAPLHVMKALRTDRRRDGAPETFAGRPAPRRTPGKPVLAPSGKAARKAAKKAFKKRLGRGKDLLEDLFDLFD